MPTTIDEIAIDDSDTWTEEDILDLSRFSLLYATTLYDGDEEELI